MSMCLSFPDFSSWKPSITSQFSSNTLNTWFSSFDTFIKSGKSTKVTFTDKTNTDII